MIHQVKISADTIDYLRQIIDLQFLLLHLAVRESVVTPENVRDTLNPTYGSKIDDVTKWITGKKKTLVEPLNQFAAHPNASNKKAFVDQLDVDIQLLFTHGAGVIQVDFNFSDDWKIAAGNFLKQFYELFNDGFPAYLFHNSLPYSRQNFISSFIQENDGLYLCAICDTVAYRASTEHHTYTSIDHFFPKARYPHLSIHPYNLVPICTLCNSWFKGDQNPLAQLGDIAELILPYGHQPGLSQQTFLQFRLRADLLNRDKHPLELLFKPTNSFRSETFILSFENIYKIQARWNEDLDQLDQHVFRRITQFLLGDVQNGYSCADATWLADRLRILMGLVYIEDLGRDPFGFATTWLLYYHIECLRYSALDKPVPIHKALIDWADKQQDHIERIRRTATSLSSRVPTQ